MRFRAGLLVIVWLALLIPSLANAEGQTPRRVALVIGNGTYQYLPRLPNPANDAELMAITLQSVGFELIGGRAQIDLDRAGFEKAIREFGAALGSGRVGLFYYAGHGVQLQGENYLVPVGANPTTAADADFEMINAGSVLNRMEVAGSGLNIVILDACRNNPFGDRGLRGMGAGLATMRAPRGTLISYATQPGNVAMDGGADHSPYTAALAGVIRKPGLEIFQAFNEVALTVDRTTGGRQQPWVATSPLEGVFYFSQQASKYDGKWRGTYSCGPHKTQPLNSFVWRGIELEVRQGNLFGKRTYRAADQQSSEAQFSGSIENDGSANVRVLGRKTNKQDDFYSVLLRKSIEPSKITLSGPMLVRDGVSVRDCQLSMDLGFASK